MLIIEGPDGAGKTTLARQILKRWLEKDRDIAGFQRFGFLGPNWDYFHDYLRCIKPYMLCDRFTWSEHVYGPILRNASQLQPFSQAVISRELNRCGALTVYLHSLPMDCIKNRKKGDALQDDVVAAAAEKYMYDQMNLGMDGLTPHDSTREIVLGAFPDYQQVENIIFAYDRLQKSLPLHPPDGSGLHPREAELVIFGEVMNDDIYNHRRAFANGPAAQCLDKILRIAGVDPCRTYMVNVQQPDGELDIKVMETLGVRFLESNKILGLGRAKEWLDQHGIEHIHMDHPSYISRFKSKELQNYGECLKASL